MLKQSEEKNVLVRQVFREKFWLIRGMGSIRGERAFIESLMVKSSKNNGFKNL
jgi:hypothetical protein